METQIAEINSDPTIIKKIEIKREYLYSKPGFEASDEEIEVAKKLIVENNTQPDKK